MNEEAYREDGWEYARKRREKKITINLTNFVQALDNGGEVAYTLVSDTIHTRVQHSLFHDLESASIASSMILFSTIAASSC